MADATTVTSTAAVVVATDGKKSKTAPPPLSAFSTAAAAPMSIKKVALIYNPVSGNKKGKKRAEKIVAPMLEAAGVTVDLSPMTSRGVCASCSHGFPSHGTPSSAPGASHKSVRPWSCREVRRAFGSRRLMRHR